MATENTADMPKHQLLHPASTAAKYLPTSSASLMNELATRFDVVSAGPTETLNQNCYLIDNNVHLKAELEALKNGYRILRVP